MGSSKVMFVFYGMGSGRQMKYPGRLVIIHIKKQKNGINPLMLALTYLAWDRWGFSPISGRNKNWWGNVLTKKYIYRSILWKTLKNPTIHSNLQAFWLPVIAWPWISHDSQTSQVASLGLSFFSCEMRLWTGGHTDDFLALWTAGLLIHLSRDNKPDTACWILSSFLLCFWDVIFSWFFSFSLWPYILSFLSLSVLFRYCDPPSCIPKLLVSPLRPCIQFTKSNFIRTYEFNQRTGSVSPGLFLSLRLIYSTPYTQRCFNVHKCL